MHTCALDAACMHARTQARLAGIMYDEAEAAALEAQREAAAEAIRRCREQVDGLGRDTASVKFSYTPPSRDWDARRVRGAVAELVQLVDPAAALALEVAAGAKLYHVSVLWPVSYE